MSKICVSIGSQIEVSDLSALVCISFVSFIMYVPCVGRYLMFELLYCTVENLGKVV
jgi:hypothetical protein